MWYQRPDSRPHAPPPAPAQARFQGCRRPQSVSGGLRLPARLRVACMGPRGRSRASRSRLLLDAWRWGHVTAGLRAGGPSRRRLRLLLSSRSFRKFNECSQSHQTFVFLRLLFTRFQACSLNCLLSTVELSQPLSSSPLTLPSTAHSRRPAGCRFTNENGITACMSLKCFFPCVENETLAGGCPAGVIQRVMWQPPTPNPDPGAPPTPDPDPTLVQAPPPRGGWAPPSAGAELLRGPAVASS